jgi:hypothetical protein
MDFKVHFRALLLSGYRDAVLYAASGALSLSGSTELNGVCGESFNRGTMIATSMLVSEISRKLSGWNLFAQ